MSRELSFQLLEVLRRGAGRLNDEARRRVCRFVESQRTDGEAFANRGGRADLYYTMFGWMLCHALGITSDSGRRKAYLDSVDERRLDPLHLTVLMLCRMLHRLLSLPRFAPSGVLPLMAGDRPLRQFFETYQQHGSGGGTNAWAARLATVPEADAALAGRLMAMQHETGGFLAYEGAPMPDLLSTAVALFALRLHGLSPRYDASPFIEAHWQDDGSFVATLLDEHGDTEYEFYGLLALGATDDNH